MSDMGLPRALKAHAANLLDEAEIHYRRAYKQGQVSEVFYQNFGALLRKQGKADESRKLLEEGLSRYPRHPGIQRNYANQLRDDKPCFAIELYLSAIRLTLGKEEEVNFVINCLEDLLELFRTKQLSSWALALIDDSLSYLRPSALMLMNLLLLMDRGDVAPQLKQSVIDAINQYLNNASLLEAVKLEFSLAAHYLSAAEHQRSLKEVGPADGKKSPQECVADNHRRPDPQRLAVPESKRFLEQNRAAHEPRRHRSSPLVGSDARLHLPGLVGRRGREGADRRQHRVVNEPE